MWVSEQIPLPSLTSLRTIVFAFFIEGILRWAVGLIGVVYFYCDIWIPTMKGFYAEGLQQRRWKKIKRAMNKRTALLSLARGARSSYYGRK